MSVTGATIHLAQIPGLYCCLHLNTITARKTRGLPGAPWLCGLPPWRSSSSTLESSLQVAVA
jgi:hypothetical protein